MVVEARVDRGFGALANVIVDRGILHVGDIVVSDVYHGKVCMESMFLSFFYM